LFASGPAGAQTGSALRLVYEASPGCPSAAAFRGQVVARTSRVRFVEGEATGQVLFVSLVQSPGRAVGRLRIDEARGSSLERELSGASCEEVVSALGLVAALAFDPQAQTAPLPPPRPPPAPEPAPEPRRQAPRTPAPLPRPRRFALGAQGRVDSGALPSFWPQAALFFDLASGRRGFFSPSGRLAAFATWRQDYQPPETSGRASFSLVGGRLEGCPVRFELAAPLEARPCLGLELARLQGKGSFEGSQLSEAVRWIAAEASGRLRWTPGAGPFFIEAQAGLGVPLTRYHFKFSQPETKVHDVPLLGGRMAFALGLSFS
jgi:hypothetical protein